MKDIPNYEKLYAATEDGRIWSYRSNKFLKPSLSKGYLRIYLYINQKIKAFYVHQLIALTFIPNIENKPTVDHINRNKLDNRVSNLRWATYKEQAENKESYNGVVHIFTQEETLKGAKNSSIKNSKPIEMRNKDNHNIIYKTFNNAEDAAEEICNDRSKGNFIRKVARGLKPSAYGYYWTYIDKDKSLKLEAGCSSSTEVTNDNTV